MSLAKKKNHMHLKYKKLRNLRTYAQSGGAQEEHGLFSFSQIQQNQPLQFH